MNIQIDDFSFSAIKVRAFFNDIECAGATAFGWRSSHGQAYLIINWHVVSGRRSDNGSNLSDTGVWPNKLRIQPHRHPAQLAPIDVSIDLYQNNEPRWLVHPRHGRQADVVALPIPEQSIFGLKLMNTLRHAAIPFLEGDDLFILRFPDGLTGGFEFPLWKCATVSSLPGLDRELLPYFLIDAVTGEGMSGAPVLRRDRLPPPPSAIQSNLFRVPTNPDHDNSLRGSSVSIQAGWEASVSEPHLAEYGAPQLSKKS